MISFPDPKILQKSNFLSTLICLLCLKHNNYHTIFSHQIRHTMPRFILDFCLIFKCCFHSFPFTAITCLHCSHGGDISRNKSVKKRTMLNILLHSRKILSERNTWTDESLFIYSPLCAKKCKKCSRDSHDKFFCSLIKLEEIEETFN